MDLVFAVYYKNEKYRAYFPQFLETSYGGLRSWSGIGVCDDTKRLRELEIEFKILDFIGVEIFRLYEESGYTLSNWYVQDIYGLYKFFKDKNKKLDKDGYMRITKRQINSLSVICEKLLKQPALADELLPLARGRKCPFVNYDTIYRENILVVYDFCNWALNAVDWKTQVMYMKVINRY